MQNVEIFRKKDVDMKLRKRPETEPRRKRPETRRERGRKPRREERETGDRAVKRETGDEIPEGLKCHPTPSSPQRKMKTKIETKIDAANQLKKLRNRRKEFRQYKWRNRKLPLLANTRQIVDSPLPRDSTKNCFSHCLSAFESVRDTKQIPTWSNAESAALVTGKTPASLHRFSGRKDLIPAYSK
jgi:hypothetical protein